MNPTSSMQPPKTLGILLDEHHFEHDSILHRTPSLVGRVLPQSLLDRMDGRLSIRGAAIAQKSIVTAFLEEGSLGAYKLLTYPNILGAAQRHLYEYYLDRRPSLRMELHAPDEFLMKDSSPANGLHAWFNPAPYCPTKGGIEISLRIRDLAANGRYPITTLLHGLSSHKTLNDLFLRIILGKARPYDSLICTSQASKIAAENIIANLEEGLRRDNEITVQYRGRLDVIPLCVDTSLYIPREKSGARRNAKLPPKAFIMTYLGRLSRSKADILPFLQLFRRLVNNNPSQNMILLLAGTEDAEYVSLIEQHLRFLDLVSQVIVKRNISDELKRDVLSSSDVLISPSDTLSENFGIVLIEAMACGVPLVVPDWNGYRDVVVHGETGFLVPTYWADCDDELRTSGVIMGTGYDHLALNQSVATDLAQMENYIQLMISNPELQYRMSQACRMRATSLYGYRSVVNQYEELWEELALQAANIPGDGGSKYDQHRYFRSFSHYPSQIVDFDSKLSLSPSKLDAIPKEIVPEILQPEILEHILTTVGNYIDCYGDVAASVATQFNCTESTIGRHIMWLVKYGFIEVIPHA